MQTRVLNAATSSRAPPRKTPNRVHPRASSASHPPRSSQPLRKQCEISQRPKKGILTPGFRLWRWLLSGSGSEVSRGVFSGEVICSEKNAAHPRRTSAAPDPLGAVGPCDPIADGAFTDSGQPVGSSPSWSLFVALGGAIFLRAYLFNAGPTPWAIPSLRRRSNGSPP